MNTTSKLVPRTNALGTFFPPAWLVIAPRGS